MGTLMADSFVNSCPDCTIALINGGAIRSSFDAGVITKGDVIRVHPFQNSLMRVEMTGDVLISAIEHSVSDFEAFAPSGKFLVPSSLLSWVFNPETGKVILVSYKGGPVDRRATYVVALASFIANGGDGYSMFLPLEKTVLSNTVTELSLIHI